MWRGGGDERRRTDTPRPGAVAGAIVVGAVVGSVLSAWVSVERSTETSGPQPGGGEVPPVSWVVDDEQSWASSVVRIATTQCLDGGVRNEIAGTGVVVDGSVVTNAHVVADASAVVVTTHDGVEHRARGIAVSTQVDLARVSVDGVGPGVDLERARGSGKALTIAGFPNGDRFAARETNVVGTIEGWGYPDPATALHLDVAVVPGESGSPIVDGDGDVVALLYGRALSDGNGLAIAAGEVRGQLRRTSDVPFESC